MLQMPKEMAYRDIVKVLEYEGWKLDRVKGSHHVFAKKEETIIVVMHHSLVKSVYVKRVIEMLNLEEKYGKK